MTQRTALNEFGTASRIYESAPVWVYAIDLTTLERTTRLLTLYDGPTGTGTLTNPQNLSSDGKWTVIPYVEEGYQIVVNSLPFGEHDLGVVLGTPGYRGQWSPTTVYQVGDQVKIGPAAEGGSIVRDNIYICAESHTADASFQVDEAAGRWLLYIDVAAATAASDAAEVAAEAAEAWAITPEDSTVPGGGGAFSALHHAAKASDSASAASASAVAAAASADAVDDRYLGAKAADPTTDNDGDPLAAGMVYYNTVSNIMKVYNAGTASWDVTLALPTPLGVAAGGTGATTESGARTSLGLQIGLNVQGYSVNLATLSAVVPSSLGLDLLASANAAAAQTSLSLVPGTHVQAYDADLAAIAALATNGLIARTSAGAAAIRSIAAGAGISVTNGDGVAGNPTIAATGGSVRSVAANDTIVAADNGGIVRVTASGITLSTTAAATLGSSFRTTIQMQGDYNDLFYAFIDPNSAEQVDDQDKIVAYQGEQFDLWCDGTKFYTSRRNGLVFFGEQAFSGAATQDLYQDSVFYDDPEIVGGKVLLDGLSHSAGGNRILRMRFFNGGAIDTGASDYSYAYMTAWAAPAGVESSGAAHIILHPTAQGASKTWNGYVDFVKGPTDNTATGHSVLRFDSGTTDIPHHHHFAYQGGAVEGISFHWDSGGNFDAGAVRYFGVRARRA